MAKDIKINFSFLCDYAFIGEAGKLSIIGMFQNINPSVVLPFIHPQIFVVVSISIKGAGSYDAEIKFIRSRDGLDVIPPQKFNIPVKDDSQTTTVLLGQMLNVKFEELGPYEAQVLVNGEKLTTIPVSVGVNK